MQHRLAQVRQLMYDQQLDALLVTDAANRRYLSGFSGSAGSLLLSADRALLLSDFRYQVQAAREAPDFEFRLLANAGALPAALPALLRELGLDTPRARLGFEAANVSVAQYSALQQAFKTEQLRVSWLATEGLVEQARRRKDAAELATLRRAIAITDAAFAAVRPLLRPEMREREAAWELEKAMRERGADGLAFDIIVAAGENGSRPHARAGDDLLGRGQPIVMDFGALLEGYHADMTRTVVLGEADERFWQIYNIVLAAQQAAEAGVRAGLTGQQADAIARDQIAAAGYGDAFGHSLGHGVGLAIHEGPRLAQTSQDTLAAGAVVSIEPGIYLPGWGGVRIEDLVALTETGLDVLTQSSKDPVVQI
jgi:Xaa-Pro aminopeptidase